MGSALLLACCLPTAASADIARAYLNGQYQRGLSIADPGIGTNDLYTPDWPIYLIKNYAEVNNTSQGTFIEAGMFMGSLSQDGCSADYSAPRVYWADKRPGSKYYCHIGGPPTVRTYYGVTIFETSAGGSTWNVGVGSFTGQSTSSLTSENQIETGTYTTAPGSSVQACDYAKGLQWFDGKGGVHYGWRDSISGPAIINQTKPPYGYFVDSPSSTDYPYWFRSYSPSSMSSCY